MPMYTLPVNVLSTDALELLQKIAINLLTEDAQFRTIKKSSRALQTKLCDPHARLLPIVLLVFKTLGFTETVDCYVCSLPQVEDVELVLVSIAAALDQRNASVYVKSTRKVDSTDAAQELEAVRALHRAKFKAQVDSKSLAE
jgi:hypothetical protein